MKNKDFFNYIKEYYNDFEEDFINIVNLSEYGIPEVDCFVSELELFSCVLDNNYFNQEVVKDYRSYLRKKMYNEAYNLLIHEYLYAGQYLTIKHKACPTKLNRKIFVPIRYTMMDLLIIVASTFRIHDVRELYLNTDNKLYAADEENIDDISIFASREYLIQNLIFANKIFVQYKSHLFNIKLNENAYSDEFKNETAIFTIKSSKGLKIVENYDHFISMIEGLDNKDEFGNRFYDVYGDIFFNDTYVVRESTLYVFNDIRDYFYLQDFTDYYEEYGDQSDFDDDDDISEYLGMVS